MSMKSSEKVQTFEHFYPVKAITDDGVLLGKDGSIGFVLKLKGIDPTTFTDSDWISLHEKWRSFLWLKPDEELQIVFRKDTNFEELLTRKLIELDLIDSPFRRRIFWKQIETFLRQIESQVRVFESSILLTYRKIRSQKKYQSSDKLIESDKKSIEDRLQTLQYQLEEMGLSPSRMEKSQIQRAVARALQSTDYLLSDSLSNEWPDSEITTNGIRVAGEDVRSLYLKKLPEEYSELGMIQHISKLPYPLSVSVRLRGKEIEPVKRKFERKRQILFGMASRKATGDPAAEAQFRDADELLRRLSEQNDGLLDMTLTVSLRSQNELLLREAINALNSTQSRLYQLEFDESPINSFDLFLETIPTFQGQVFHKHSVLSSNALAFLPLFETDQGDDDPVISYTTVDGSPYSLSPVSPRLANFNLLVSGASGAGKSFFVNSFLMQSLPLDPRIWIVDIGGSYNKLTEFLGGKVVGLDVDKGFQVGPFFMARSENEAEERRRREHIEIIFREMCRDEGKLPSVEERAILSEALEPLFEADSLPEHPIQSLSQELSTRKDPKAIRLGLLLRRWAYPNFFGSFLDHSSPLEISEDIVTFDLKGLQEFEELSKVVELIICSALWSSLRERKRFTFIVLDEVAFSLLRSQPQFVDELVSTVRKHFAGVITVVQGLEKITGNKIAGASILNNSARKVILQQRGSASGWEEPLSVNETEAQIIRSLKRVKGHYSDIFLMDEDKRAVLRFEPDPLTYWLSTSDSRDNERLKESLSRYDGIFSDKLFQFIEKETA